MSCNVAAAGSRAPILFPVWPAGPEGRVQTRARAGRGRGFASALSRARRLSSPLRPGSCGPPSTVLMTSDARRRPGRTVTVSFLDAVQTARRLCKINSISKPKRLRWSLELNFQT